MPRPPMKRAIRNESQFQAKEQPSADSTYKAAVMRRVARLPIFCPILPADMAPITVPQRAMDTVKPRLTGLREKYSERVCVVPAITAVSNPNKRPPSAPVIELRRRYLLRAKIKFLLSARS